jgi:FkbM family methyltransferase
MHSAAFEQLRAEGILIERDCRHGRLAFLRTDVYMAQSLGHYAEFSQSEIDVWKHFVREGDTVFTAGANIGAHVVWFSRQVGPKGRVITCEPQSLIHEIMTHNLELNGCRNVDAHRLALGERGGNANIPRPDYRWPDNFGSAHLVDSLIGTERVEVATVDQLIGERKVRMIHLDIEGHEARALAGALGTIEASRPLLNLEVDREEQRNDILRILARLNYQPLMHYGPLYNPRNFAQNPVNAFGDMVSINLLALPAEAA